VWKCCRRVQAGDCRSSQKPGILDGEREHFFETGPVGSAAGDPLPAHQRTELERVKIVCKIVEDLVYEFPGKLGGHGQEKENCA
jgi:hypothetical protein